MGRLLAVLTTGMMVLNGTILTIASDKRC